MSNHQSHDHAINVLQVRRLGIDTYYEPVVFMRSDCAICRSEGFESHSRILVSLRGHHVLATLNIVTGDLVGTHEIGLSEITIICLKGGKLFQIFLIVSIMNVCYRFL